MTPPSLTSRIISIREQIAQEWSSDLDIVIQAGELILDSYFDNVIQARDDEDYDETNAAGSETTTPPLFDRTAMSMLSNIFAYNDQPASPLRRGNFNLLMLLATQEIIHRLLRVLQQQQQQQGNNNNSNNNNNDAESFQWLSEFYKERVETFFDGDQNFGRYDDFLEELLRSVPSVRRQQSGQKMTIIYPVRLAEQINRAWADVAREWKDIVLNVSTDHVDLKRNILTRQMMMNTQQQQQQHTPPPSTTNNGNGSSVDMASPHSWTTLMFS